MAPRGLIEDGCDVTQATAAITEGGTSFMFGVGALSYSVGSASLTAACGSVLDMVSGRALGLFELDALVVLGGPVQAFADGATATAGRLKSLPGFGGTVTAGPPGVNPLVAASFETVRRTAGAAPPPLSR